MLTQFITQERAQKLDLLGHLIRNLRQSLVIFGPKGIGKTTFLQALNANKSDSGALLLLQATERLSFEQIQEQLFHELEQYISGGRVDSLAQLLNVFDKHNQYVVLLLDDAGLLLPGLITTLVQYAAQFNNLRIVFALTQEDLGAKHKTDREIEDCHFLEIPPLSLKQSGEYMHHLNANTDVPGASGMLNEAMVERVYKKTAGVPGQIIELLPSLATSRYSGSGWILALAVAGLTSVVVGVLLWRNIENVVDTSAKSPAVTTSTTAMPLAIPGQVAPPSESSSQPTAAGNAEVSTAVVTPSPRMSHPEISNTKPDYYSGFTRVREADALDEFKNKSEAAKPGEQIDQLKVEIMTPEPPPKEVVLTTAKNEPELETKPDLAVVKPSPNVQEAITPIIAPVPKKVASAEKPLSTVVTPKQTNAEPKVDTIANVNKPEIKRVKNNLDAVKPDVTVKVVKKEIKKEPTLALKEINPPKAVKKPALEAPQVLNPDLPEDEEKRVIIDKQKPENEKPAVMSQAKPESELKAEVTEKKIERVAPDIDNKKISPKPEQAVVVEPSKMVESQNDDAKPAPDTVDKVNAAPDNMAKLGVVMKYKSEQPHSDATEKPKADKKESSANVAMLANTENKPEAKAATGAKFTLQVMTFSQQQSLQNFLGKYGNMGGLRHFTVSKEGVEHYVVVYGAYDSIAQANAAKQKLPAEFRQALARKM